MITKLFAAEGDTVTVGAQLLEFDTDGKAPADGAAKKDTPKVTFLVIAINN